MAVVVAHEPGAWFVETLESLAVQDYAHLRVAVIDAAGSRLAAQVRSVMPDAVVMGTGGSNGFSEAANTILSADLQAEFLLICHDDVALAPDTVSILVAEAERSSAGIVGPKLVDWDRPEMIRQAGYEVDRFGFGAAIPGFEELDQEQFDGVRDVFAVPSAVLLIRRTLFMTLGGFDAAVTFVGEDIDLCWRAQMAGARVMIAGGAVVRHRARLAKSMSANDLRATRARHALRAMLVNHGRISLILLIPAALLLSVVEVGLSVVTARFSRARAVIRAWTWNLARLNVTAQRRSFNARIRKVRQADVVAGQYLGSLRVNSFIRRHFGGDRVDRGDRGHRSDRHALLRNHAVGSRGSNDSSSPDSRYRTGSSRLVWAVWIFVAAFVLLASRSLIINGVPAVGDFAPFPETSADMLRDWWGGWSDRGTGAPSSNLGGLVFMGLLGLIFTNSMGLVRTLLVITPIVVGLIGAYRLLAQSGSRRAQAATLVAYLVVPLVSASVSGGSLSGLIGYAAAPWMLRELLRASGATPFRGGGRQWRSLPGTAVSLGAVAGLAALWVPAAAGLLLLLTASLVVGSLLAGRPGGIGRLLTAAVLAVPVAAFVAFGLLVDVLAAGPTWAMIADGRDGSAGTTSLGEILRLAVGPHDPGNRVWLFAVPMAVPLLLGRGWRLEQAVRLWIVAVASWALVLVAQHGHLPFGLPDQQLLLAPAAVAVAGLCGMAVLAIEHDLRFSHFGWRQALMPVVAMASVVLLVGSLGVLDSGRWGLGKGDHHAELRFEPPVLAGSYRVLWIGDPEFLPVEGRSLAPGVAWAATNGDVVTILDRAVPVDPGHADLFETVIEEMASGQTSRGGRMLAGLAVRYVVLLNRLVPAPFLPTEQARPVPGAVSSGLRSQLDLELLDGTNSAVDVFVNSSWVPARSLQPAGFDSGISQITDLEARPLTPGAALFSGDGHSWSGSVPEGAEVWVAHTSRPGWELSVAGVEAPRRAALSWGRAYLPPAGEAVFSYTPPWWRRAGQLVGVAATVLLAAGWARRRMERV